MTREQPAACEHWNTFSAQKGACQCRFAISVCCAGANSSSVASPENKLPAMSCRALSSCLCFFLLPFHRAAAAQRKNILLNAEAVHDCMCEFLCLFCPVAPFSYMFMLTRLQMSKRVGRGHARWLPLVLNAFSCVMTTVLRHLGGTSLIITARAARAAHAAEQRMRSGWAVARSANRYGI